MCHVGHTDCKAVDLDLPDKEYFQETFHFGTPPDQFADFLSFEAHLDQGQIKRDRNGLSYGDPLLCVVWCSLCALFMQSCAI